MLTLFSCPKPFRGHINTIQRNAIQSWLRLSPACEVILFGDEEGTQEAASFLRVRHISRVSRNEYGTPLLDDVFAKAEGAATHDIVGYVNADIILMSDIVKAIECVRREKTVFLMVGQRWNIDVESPVDFSQPDWEEKLRRLVLRSGKPTPHLGWIDYFIFPRGLYRDLFPFALGRAGFDNWLLWKAHSLKAPVIDASQAVMAVHQNHDYSHHPQGERGVWEGAEAKRNRELMGGWHHSFTLSDASHRLVSTEIKLNLSGERLFRIVLLGGLRLLHWFRTKIWRIEVA
jgi:hypothetical protein